MIKYKITSIAEEIAERFLQDPDNISLNQEILERVKSGEIPEDYIRMLASEVNHKIYVGNLKRGEAIEFTPAKADEIKEMLENEKSAELIGEDFDPEVPPELQVEFLKEKQKKQAEKKEAERIQLLNKLADLEIELEKRGYNRLPIVALATRQDMYTKYGEMGLRVAKNYLIELGYIKEAEYIFPNVDPSNNDWWISDDDLENLVSLAKDFQESGKLSLEIERISKELKKYES